MSETGRRNPTPSLSGPINSEAMAATNSRREITALNDDLPLRRGGVVRSPRVAWEMVGPDDAPIVFAMGGISANRHVTAVGDAGDGWWQDFAGPGGAIDTARFRVLGIDFLGGNGETTGPRTGADSLPAVDPADQAALLARLHDQQGWPPFRAFFGSSYGGMVALHFAADAPDRLQQLVVIGAAHRPPGIATALRTIQRRAIRECVKRNEATLGLELARAVGMVTYRSEKEFDVRFEREPTFSEGHARFDVENYLFSRGEAFARAFHPQAVLTLSESIDLQRIEPERIATPTELFCAESDFVAPVSLMTELRDRLAGPCRYTEYASIYGHDAFLKETELLGHHFRRILADDAQPFSLTRSNTA